MHAIHSYFSSSGPSLIGVMRKTEGKIGVYGTIAYVPQRHLFIAHNWWRLEAAGLAL